MSVDDKTATATLVRGFNKRVGRTKEIVLQSMGKVDRTEDGTFDFYVSNFSKQQANATKLQKYMGNYITTVRSMVHASIAYQDALKEVYEDEWAGKLTSSTTSTTSKDAPTITSGSSTKVPRPCTHIKLSFPTRVVKSTRETGSWLTTMPPA